MMAFRVSLLWIFTWLVRSSWALQGDSYCGSSICIGAFGNDTQWTCKSCVAKAPTRYCHAKQLLHVYTTKAYSLIDQMRANLGEKDFGWMAIGFGTMMINSSMIIMWPNPDGTVTLSHRASKGHTEPVIDQNPPRVATKYLQLSSQTANETNLAFTIPSNGQTRPTLIWALSSFKPSSSEPDARLLQHHMSGGIFLDLTRTVNENTIGTTVLTEPSGEDVIIQSSKVRRP